jgi:hypothetical protein
MARKLLKEERIVAGLPLVMVAAGIIAAILLLLILAGFR